jgi:hypothetical protein
MAGKLLQGEKMFTRKNPISSFLLLSLILSLFLGACGKSESIVDSSGELAVIDFAKVEVGLGSPTPVSITVDVNTPKACTQISQINQKLIKDGANTRILVEVRVMDMGEICVDFPQSFRLVLPINASGLPKGNYSVEVNGVDAGNFEFEN